MSASDGSRSPSPTRKATRKKEWREEAWRKGRVTVEVLGARNLPADEDVSDPFVALRLVDVAERNPLPFPFDRCVRTAVVKGSLEPEWSDERFHFDDVGPALPYVRVQVMDYNGPIHKPRLLGEVDVSLEALQRLGGAHGSVAAQWYPIKNSDREPAGEVELKVDLLPSSDVDEKQLAIKDAAESRWFPDVIPDDVVDLSEGEPNCLKVAVIRAKDLRAVDDGTIGRKQSNPLVVVDVIAPGQLCDEVETLTVEDDLDPVWCQSLNAPLPENVDVRTLALRVRVIDEDEDRITKRRLMGQTAFRLDRLPKQLEEDGSSVAKWYALGPGPDDIDDDDRGEILLACRLVHEPSFIKVGDSAFFSEEAIDEEMLQTPNEVRVAVLRCENLRPKISAAWRPLQRTVPQANPYVSVSVEPGDGFVQRTRTKFAELNPIYNEAFAFEIDGHSVAEAENNANTVVVASCYARDGVDGDDAFIGRALMPLGALAREPGQVGRAWVPLLDEQDVIVGRCLMEAQCVYDASHEFAPFDVSGDRDLGPFPPNQLSVAVFRARGVPPPPPKSYDRLAPSSDVAIELQIPGGEPLQIGSRQRTGAPLWRAVKTVELSAPTEYDGEHPQNNWETLQDYEIEVVLRDDSVLGRGAVPLANLCDSTPRRTFQGWVALRAPPNSEAEAHLDKWRCGVFVALHWSHNPVLHYEPFSLSKSENTKQYPNELCIAVVRARGLHAPDGESNASVLLAVPTADGEDIEHEVETKPRAGSEPAWKEAFFLGLEDPFLRKHPPVVQLGVRSRGMSLGRGDLPLRLGLDRRVHTEWVSLQDEGYAEEFAGGAVEVRFMLRYNEELDRFFDPHSKDRLAAAQAAKNAQQYLMQLAEDRDRRNRIAEALARDARMAAAAAERARVYLEELVEKRKETLPEILKEDEADDGIYRECAAGLADQVRVYLERAEREGRLRQALNERGSSRGRGLLHVAALNNQLECLDVLLHDFGAPCNPRSLLGRDTPLHLAAQQGHRKACFLLCQAGADATIQNKFGATPLHYTTKRSICRMLLRHGANILVRDCNGRTVLEAAEANNAPEETIKEIHSVKMDQERERYAANMELDQKRRDIFNANMAAREERATRAKREAAIKAQRDDYMNWKHGRITGNQVLAERLQRQQTEERWARMTKVKEIDPEQERRIEASRSMSGVQGGGFAKGMRMFAKGAWSGNDDEAQRGRKRMGEGGGALAIGGLAARKLGN